MLFRQEKKDFQLEINRFTITRFKNHRKSINRKSYIENKNNSLGCILHLSENNILKTSLLDTCIQSFIVKCRFHWFQL